MLIKLEYETSLNRRTKIISCIKLKIHINILSGNSQLLLSQATLFLPTTLYLKSDHKLIAKHDQIEHKLLHLTNDRYCFSILFN